MRAMFSAKNTVSAALMALFFLVPPAGAEIIEVDFNAALTNSTGWVYGDKVKIFSSGEACFIGSGVRVSSPLFDRPVVSFTLRYRGTNGENPRGLSVVPVFDGADGDDALWRQIPGDADETTFSVSWPKEAQVESFALVSGGGSGYLYLVSGSIELADDYLPAPDGLENSAVFRDSFHAAWTPPPGATGHVFRLWHLETVPESFASAVWAPDFSLLANSGGNPAAFSGFGDGSGVEFASVQLPANSSGVLQVGTGSAYGSVVFPAAESWAGRTLVMEVRAYNPAANHSLSVGYELGGVTNELARLEYGDSFTAVSAPLDAVPAGARALVKTLWKEPGRFVASRIAILEGYTPEHREEADDIAGQAVAVPRLKCRGLTEGREYFWAVRSIAEGLESAFSAPLAVVPGGSPEPVFFHFIVR